MRISIITVSFNAVKTIEQTIKSVITQSYENIEYLIRDGQSTDGTGEIIQKYENTIDYFVSEPDEGIYDAMNKGLRKATGDVIGIINSDDWYEPDVISKIARVFKTTDAELVYGKIGIVNDKGDISISANEPLNQLWHSMVTPHPSVFVRREIYDKYGVFNTKFRIAADYELMLRFYIAGVKFRYMDMVTVNFRTGGVSSTRAVECAEETKTISLSYLERFPGNKEIVEEWIKKKYYGSKFMAMCNEKPLLLVNYLNVRFKRFRNEIIIFGTGIWGEHCYDLFRQCNIRVIAFVDNNKDKWGVKIHDIYVENPRLLEETRGYVLIAVRYSGMEIGRQLENYNNKFLQWITIDEIISRISMII